MRYNYKKRHLFQKIKHAKLSALTSPEFRNLARAVDDSGKIEGNTYTYVETEVLLKDDVTSPKRYEDATRCSKIFTTVL